VAIVLNRHIPRPVRGLAGPVTRCSKIWV